MGRPTKLTMQVHSAILASIRGGAFASTAAAAAGISEATFHRWMRRGRQAIERVDNGGELPEEEIPYKVFHLDVVAAEAEVEVAAASALWTAARAGDWRAASWLLERRFPAHWGARAQVEHSVPNQKIADLLADCIVISDEPPPAELQIPRPELPPTTAGGDADDQRTDDQRPETP